MFEVKRKKTQVSWEISVCSWIASKFNSCLHCYIVFRSSHQRCFIKIDVLKNFTKFTGKHLCQSFFVNKVTGLRPATLLRKRLWYRCFPANFVKFLRITFLQNTSGRLLPCFEHAQTFHISHFTYHLRYYMIIDYCWSC